MFKALLHLGIIVTALFFIPGLDMRDLKMNSALVFAMAIGAAGLYSFGIRRFSNKWLLILLAYIPVSVYLAPKPSISLMGMDVAYFWSWEPIFQITAFSLLAMTVASYRFDWGEVDSLLKTVFYVGTFVAAYMILQFFMMDQFFKPLESFLPGRGQVAGFIGNPTLTAPFVLMILPIAVYLKKYAAAFLMVVAILMTNSQVAMGAMGVVVILMMASKGWKWLIVAVLISAASAGYVATHPKIVQDNQRFQMWKQIAVDIKSPIAKDIENAYPLTGRGIGSFKYVFHSEHPGTELEPNRFVQAHNDYLEFAYGTGILGLFLLLMAMWKMLAYKVKLSAFLCGWQDCRKIALSLSFIGVAICAGGTFAFQIGSIAFLTSVIVGLLHNETV